MRYLTLFSLALTITLALLPACGRSPTEVRQYDPPARTPDATYVTRAIIDALPIPGDPKTELRAHHEAVDDFKDRTGKIVGMGAMIMDFPPAKGVSLAGLKVGDKVTMTWSVWWDSTPAWLAVKLEKLPPDTKIEFRKAKPPVSTPPADAK